MRLAWRAFIFALLVASQATVSYGQVPAGAAVYKVASLTDGGKSLKATFYYLAGGEDSAGSAGVVVQGPDGKIVAQASATPSIGLREGTGIYLLTGDGKPSFALVSQVGAKTIAANIYRLDGGTLHSIFEWSGWDFRVAEVDHTPILAVSPAQAWISDLYQWSDGKFVECNECHPDYYKAEIEVQREGLGDSGVPAYVFAQACVLGATALVYGEKYEEAEQLCEHAERVVNDASRLIPSEIGNPGIIAGDQAKARARIEETLSAIAGAKQARRKRLVPAPDPRIR